MSTLSPWYLTIYPISIANQISYTPQPDSKTLLSRALYSYVIKYEETELVLSPPFKAKGSIQKGKKILTDRGGGQLQENSIFQIQQG